MKGKRFSKKKKSYKILTKYITKIIPLFFILIMIFTGIKILIWIKDNIQNNKNAESISNYIEIDEKTESIEKYNIDFESLKQTNSETIAWIKVNGTSIEYPIVKTNNNDYYMTHSFDKTKNSAGWVFMDYRDKFDGTDKNMVIYAHNRRDGSMFGTLKNILSEDWQNNEENLIIPFITSNGKEEYRVFSVYKIENEDYYITTNFETNNKFQSFIDTIKSRSWKNFDVYIGTEDQILTLSTCADNNKYRVVLHAKKIFN